MAASTSSAASEVNKSNLGYVDGAIVRITVENFLTYDSCEVKPGPHLNMIIGPNTSGKSSIVCAICLGLAGRTSVLGRAQSVAEFIKHGKPKATIEIELFNPGGRNLVIRREIMRPNKSEWSIGGKQCPQKTVEETVFRKKIQVSNLCQFLPQDKVADFAKMTPQELLENTEKASGEDNMYENHQTLKTAREKSRSLERAVQNTSEILEREKQKNARLEADVKNYHAKQQHRKKAEMLQMKLAWVVYEEKRKFYTQEKERKDAMAAQLKALRKNSEPLKRELQTVETSLHQIEAKMKTVTELVKDQARSAANRSKDIEKESDKIQEVLDVVKMKKTEEMKRRKQLAEFKQHLRTLEENLAQVDESEDIQGMLEDVNQNMRETNAEMNGIANKGDQLKAEINATKREINGLQNELARIQDLSKQRLNLLRSRHKDTYNAVLWLRENKHRFRGTIHEPLMLIINVLDARFAKYIEAHVNFNDMIVFVCENPDDSELFLKCVRDEQKLQINAALAPGKPAAEFHPKIPINHLKRFGFASYLREQIDCPDGAMSYLCSLYYIHGVPVGNDDTKRKLQSLTEQVPGLNRFFTNHHSYAIKRSKYGGNASTRCTEIKEASLLTVMMDKNQEKELTTQIKEKASALVQKEEEYRNLQSSHKDLEARMNQLRAQKKKLNERKDSKRSLQQKINMKQQSIKRLEDASTKIENEEAIARQKIEKINQRKVVLMKELMQFTSTCQESSFEKVRASLKHAASNYRYQVLKGRIHDEDKDLHKLEREFEVCKEQLKDAKERARELLKKAKVETNTAQNEELSHEMQKAFSVLPNTVDEITVAIHQVTARAECTYNTDEKVVDDYNKRKKEITKQAIELTNREEALERHQAEVEEVKARWLGPLQNLIERINTNFSYFFSCMKCAGEVDLNVPDNPEDYEKYGVKIKVKYRDNEPLRELTPHHQSGGERSVATVLFMMALQELTKCPFRCVDEINQGMDPQNERKVFELVVKSACREDTPQYFLLTPKLLPNLDYGDRMTILCVYNGPKMIYHSDWAMKKFVKRRSRLS